MNRTYSASVKHDENGKTLFVVSQNDRFILDCPTMRLASAVAMALSDEFSVGFHLSEKAHAKKADFDEVITPAPPIPPPVRTIVEGVTLSPLTEGKTRGGNGAVKWGHPSDMGSGTAPRSRVKHVLKWGVYWTLIGAFVAIVLIASNAR